MTILDSCPSFRWRCAFHSLNPRPFWWLSGPAESAVDAGDEGGRRCEFAEAMGGVRRWLVGAWRRPAGVGERLAGAGEGLAGAWKGPRELGRGEAQEDERLVPSFRLSETAPPRSILRVQVHLLFSKLRAL